MCSPYRQPYRDDEPVPDRSNLFGTIDTGLSRADLAALFAAAGWHLRKCERDAYLLETSFAELVLEAQRPILLHGALADVLRDAPRVAEVLRAAASNFLLECYSPGGALMAKVDAKTSAAW